MTGLLGIDYAWARPDLAKAHAAGYRYIARYLAPTNNATKGRIIDAAEVARARQVGMGVVLVWEWTASRSGQGYAAGQADARQADAMSDDLGFPRDRPIYYATDYDGTFAAVQPYYQGVKTTSKRPVGAYGGIRVVDPLLASGIVSFGWQTVAWSAGRVSATAHLYQRLAPTIPSGIPAGDIDENVSLRPDFGAAWLPTQEDTMAKTSVLTDQEHSWLAGAVMLGAQQQARMGDLLHYRALELVPQWYTEHLGRSAKPGEVAFWVGRVDTLGLRAVEAEIAGSAEAKAYAAKKPAKAKS